MAERGDAAGAHGLRSAIVSRTDLDDTTARKVFAALESIGSATYRQSLADLVGSQHELLDIEVRGPRAEYSVQEPVKVLAAARAASRVPRYERGDEQRYLGDGEVRELRALAGVPAPTTD